MESLLKEDIKRLLKSPLYTTDMPTEHPEHFWIPLLGLFTGARLNEIASLYVEDIRNIEGIPCFDINENKSDKRTKNKTSNRIIPIHPTLISIGFMRYVNVLKTEGVKRLWPKLTHNDHNGYAGWFGTWYGIYNRKYITQDEKKTFKSFRRTISEALRLQKVNEEIRCAIDGHAYATKSQIQIRYSR